MYFKTFYSIQMTKYDRLGLGLLKLFSIIFCPST